MSWVRSLFSGLKKRWRLLLRMLGLVLLALLLLRIDIDGVVVILRQANLWLVLIAALLLIPLIGMKSLRWLMLIGSDSTWSNYYRATLVYFSGLFLGFITPGRLGEFVRVIYARQQLEADTVAATLTVLVDRLFDLSALFLVGGLAFLTLPAGLTGSMAIGWSIVGVGLLIPLALLALISGDWLIKILGRHEVQVGRFSLERWLRGIGDLPSRSFWPGILITTIAYALFYGQGFLLTRALGIELNYFQIASTMSLASLVALLPISISGLGTREWAITLYFAEFGVAAEQALAFSALILIAFNLWGSLLGGLCWMLFPQGLRWEPMEAETQAGLASEIIPSWLKRFRLKGGS